MYIITCVFMYNVCTCVVFSCYRSALDDLAELQGFSTPSNAHSSFSPAVSSNNPFQSDSFASSNSTWSQNAPSGYQEVDLFTEIRGKPQPDFDSVFGGLGGAKSSMATVQSSPSRPPVGGYLLTPEAVGVHANMKQPMIQVPPGLTQDVDTSLVMAAENLCESCIKLHVLVNIVLSCMFSCALCPIVTCYSVALTFGDKTGMVKK